MKRYKSYEEAKIANPESEIWVNTNGNFGLRNVIAETIYTMHKCIVSDYCMSADEFRSRGHAFVDGDLVVNINDMVQSVKADFLNTVDSPLNLCTFVLRAAALETQMNIDNLATQTPEEKEALDSIKPVHLRDYQKADKPHVKVEYEKVTESIFDLREEFERGELHYDFGDEDWFTFNDEASLVAGFKEGNVYRRIQITETPQQREERERLEAVEEMFTYWSDDKGDFVAGDDDDRWVKELLFSLYDSGYRKESN